MKANKDREKSPNWSVFEMRGHLYLMNGPIIICKLK